MLAYRRLLGSACLITVLGFSLALGGCTDQEAEEAALADQQRQEEFSVLETRRSELENKRAELDELRAQRDAAPAEDGDEAEGTEPAMSDEELAAEISRLEQEIDNESQQLYSDIVTFFNADPPNEGEPLDEMQRSIVTMKSDEDIRMGDEYIEKGGDYDRALQIYRDAQGLDPDNPRLQEAIDGATELRYMSEERFSQVKKGMTPAEVRGALGRTKPRNEKDYGKGVTAWFYPKSERLDAAAVYFRERGGQLKVYEVDYDAVAGKEVEGEGADS